MRTFVAVSLPRENLVRVADWIRKLRELDLHARYPRTESIHLTLKFLGEIEETQTAAISKALETATAGKPVFNLEISIIGGFPSTTNPRVVWLGIHENGSLQSLQRSIDRSLTKCGFEREKRPFHPHLTLARIKSRRNLDRLQSFILQEGREAEAGSFSVEAVHLYQSSLRPSGAEYRKLSTHPLEAD